MRFKCLAGRPPLTTQDTPHGSLEPSPPTRVGHPSKNKNTLKRQPDKDVPPPQSLQDDLVKGDASKSQPRRRRGYPLKFMIILFTTFFYITFRTSSDLNNLQIVTINFGFRRPTSQKTGCSTRRFVCLKDETTWENNLIVVFRLWGVPPRDVHEQEHLPKSNI